MVPTPVLSMLISCRQALTAPHLRTSGIICGPLHVQRSIDRVLKALPVAIIPLVDANSPEKVCVFGIRLGVRLFGHEYDHNSVGNR